jgi:Calcium-activated potassium channel, beta subunit
MYHPYKLESMEGASPVGVCATCRKRINYILGFGIVLALIGASLLVAFGLLYVRPYVYMRHLVGATCSTQDVVSTGDIVSCTCASDGSGSCMSHYPCLRITVNYTTEDEPIFINATLYDSFETYTIQRGAQQVGENLRIIY